MKSIIAAGILLGCSAPAFAGPYANIETNAGYTGDDYNSAVTDFHVGWEGELGEKASFYVQGGPAIVAVDGQESETEISGKAGLGVDVTEQLNIYGELAWLTEDRSFSDNLGTSVKAGAKFNFWFYIT